MGIQRVRQTVCRNGRFCPEIGNIAFGVNACIGSAAAGYMNLVPNNCRNSFFQRLLHCGQILLRLPAVVGSSLICQKQGNIPHSYLTSQIVSG